ncbi:MAG: transposase, partial [Actinomycetota bacterium]|nr:transposase [Actinomycetota bacterium]
ARAALVAQVQFALGAKRIAPLWPILDGLTEDDWTDALDMTGAQVAVAEYCPAWWPTSTRLLIRRVALTPEQISADPRSRRRRTLHPDQRALPLAKLAEADTVYGYSFIVTNLKVSTPAKAAAVEHWYRHRTAIENVFRDAKLGAALRHLPSGYPQVNTAWMWAALLAASIAGWLHQLTATPGPDGLLVGHGVRDGQAMIATLRQRLIRIPARLIHHAGALDLRLPPGHHLLKKSSPASAPFPQHPDQAIPAPTTPEPRPPEATLGPPNCPQPKNQPETINTTGHRSTHRPSRGIGSEGHRQPSSPGAILVKPNGKPQPVGCRGAMLPGLDQSADAQCGSCRGYFPR